MFVYENGHLMLRHGRHSVRVSEVAKGRSQAFYLYDIGGLREWYRFFCHSVKGLRLKTFFAIKANSNHQVLKALQAEAAGADVVSSGEAILALKAGFSPKRIIFSGVGKSSKELSFAVKKGLFQLNVESFEELKKLAQISKRQKKVCKIGLRLNPNVDFPSHPYIKTGLSGHKFGIEEEDLPEILAFIRSSVSGRWIQLQGLSIHLGSQIFDPKPLFQAIRHLKKTYNSLKREHSTLQVLDIGGGFGVHYQRSDFEKEKALLKSFGQGLKNILKDFDGLLIAEPGRVLSARFGILCAKIEYIKKSRNKKFVILNSGMNHFLRSALYGAEHRILPLYVRSEKKETYEVVGPICETADCFAKNKQLPVLKAGGWLAIADTGAYGYTMASVYNGRPLPKEIGFYKGKEI